MSGLTDREITRIVNRYIGVSGGYLGDFSYRSHADFYPEYCDMEINPYAYEGTTRERFIAILSSREPRDQARILRGVLERFPPDQGPEARQVAQPEVLTLIQRLESGPLITAHTPQITSQVVLRALTDAETLIQTSGSTSAVDRAHTILHGYLMAVCDDCGIAYRRDDSMVSLFRAIQGAHPKFTDLGRAHRTSERFSTHSQASSTPCSRYATRQVSPIRTRRSSTSQRVGSSSTRAVPSSTTSTTSSHESLPPSDVGAYKIPPDSVSQSSVVPMNRRQPGKTWRPSSPQDDLVT